MGESPQDLGSLVFLLELSLTSACLAFSKSVLNPSVSGMQRPLLAVPNATQRAVLDPQCSVRMKERGLSPKPTGRANRSSQGLDREAERRRVATEAWTEAQPS